jgi:DNA-binding transcriptional MerR regulator
MDSDERQYTLQELATIAGVSIRTVRYYIGEGLLPAPVGAGPQSHYTSSHLIRLRAIGLLKDRYLPLKEIRRALAGLDDAAVERLIADLEEPGSVDSPVNEVAEAKREYWLPAAAPRISEDSGPAYDALSYIDSVLERGRSSLGRRRGSARRERQDTSLEGASWRKIEIADGVELLVRDDIVRRRRDRIEWLVDWARKVVD